MKKLLLLLTLLTQRGMDLTTTLIPDMPPPSPSINICILIILILGFVIIVILFLTLITILTRDFLKSLSIKVSMSFPTGNVILRRDPLRKPADPPEPPRVNHAVHLSGRNLSRLLRIVGGTNSAVDEWPWQVSLHFNGNANCGGSLISDTWVLTAAHCFNTMPDPLAYTIYLGLYQLSDLQNPKAMSRTVKQIIIHPNYPSEQSSGDIALVKLESPVAFTSSIHPVYLPSRAVQLPEGTLCWVTGWGYVREEVPLTDPKTLQKVDVALIDSKNCETMYMSDDASESNSKLIQEDMFCAGYQEGKKDTCQGDSGGPLVCNVNGVWLQLGITSWGLGCASANRPGVYTRVQHYQSWLQGLVPSLQFSNGGKILHPNRRLKTTQAPRHLTARRL
ncbi:serine protease 27-like [Dendrobates tinctorius]|uniref:serine protease 27-like n=1 Tax=Dendrobates tinctorius TaxID=92724 RepID=UPI003CC951D5